MWKQKSISPNFARCISVSYSDQVRQRENLQLNFHPHTIKFSLNSHRIVQNWRSVVSSTQFLSPSSPAAKELLYLSSEQQLPRAQLKPLVGEAKRPTHSPDVSESNNVFQIHGVEKAKNLPCTVLPDALFNHILMALRRYRGLNQLQQCTT